MFNNLENDLYNRRKKTDSYPTEHEFKMMMRYEISLLTMYRYWIYIWAGWFVSEAQQNKTIKLRKGKFNELQFFYSTHEILDID